MVPCVLDTRVLPTLRTEKTEGALMSYQSFLEKGSTLQDNEQRMNETSNSRFYCEERNGGGRASSRLLLASLLALADPLVLSHRHDSAAAGAAAPVLGGAWGSECGGRRGWLAARLWVGFCESGWRRSRVPGLYLAVRRRSRGGWTLRMRRCLESSLGRLKPSWPS